MSEVAFTDLEDRVTGDKSPVADVLAGFAKAWVAFDGTGTVTIIDDFNVTSIADNGVGNYTANFTNNMPNADYAVAASGVQLIDSAVGSVDVVMPYTYAVGSVSVTTRGDGTSTTGTDLDRVSVAVFCNV